MSPNNPLRGIDPVMWKDPLGPGSQPEDQTGTRHPRRLENSNTSTIDSTGMQPRARLKLNVSGATGTTFIPNNAFTPIAFDTVVIDSIGLWKAAAPTNIVFPSITSGYKFTGMWLLHGHITWVGGAGTVRQIQISNTVAGNTVVAEFDGPAVAAVVSSQDVLALVDNPLNIGGNSNTQTFQFRAFQDSGGNLNIDTAAIRTFFEIIQLW